MARSAPEPDTTHRIERALAYVAYLVARDDAGIVYLPIMERLERELEAARQSQSPRERARRLLSAGLGLSVRLPQIQA